MSDLTPQLRQRLQVLANTSSVTFDLRYKPDDQELKDYAALRRLGYCTETETGPGGSVLIYKITPQGKTALDS